MVLLAIMAVALFVDRVLMGGWLTVHFGCRPVLLTREPWRLLTAVFLHGGLMHLLFNGLWIFILGQIVEPRLGGPRFLALFLLSGIGGNLCWALLNWNNPLTEAIGASGAVFGGMAAAAYLAPYVQLYVWGLLPVKMRDLAIFYFILEVLLSFTSYSDGIAHMAHAGGAVVGFLYIVIDQRVRQRWRPPTSWPPRGW
jgi:membrane associated rhomboid family serine protease